MSKSIGLQKTKVDWATEEVVMPLLKELDFKLWFERRKITSTRKQLEAKTGKRIRPSMFKSLRQKLRWWTVERRPWPSKNCLLDASDWQRLREAVKQRLADIQGRTLEEAVAIVSIDCPCNHKTLEGLNSDLRVWKQ